MRMVACDLDGTIVGTDGLISVRTLERSPSANRPGFTSFS